MSKYQNKLSVRRLERLDKPFGKISVNPSSEGIIFCDSNCTNFIRTTSCKGLGSNVGHCFGETVYARSSICNKERS